MGLGIVRPPGQCRPEGFLRLGNATASSVNHAEIVIGPLVLGLQPNCGPKLSGRVIKPSLFHIDYAEVVPRVGEGRTFPDYILPQAYPALPDSVTLKRSICKHSKHQNDGQRRRTGNCRTTDSSVKKDPPRYKRTEQPHRGEIHAVLIDHHRDGDYAGLHGECDEEPYYPEARDPEQRAAPAGDTEKIYAKGKD